jgi:DNA-binding transcriptional regulator YdaS (Cro superfamily)
MTNQELKAWTSSRNGRATYMAAMIDLKRGTLNSYVNGWADVPPGRVVQIRQAMRRIERAEAILDSKVMRRKVK